MILIFLADGFEEVEALAVVDILRRANLNVSMVGVTGSWVKGAHGIRVECDTEIEKLKPSEDIEAVILPGGMPGTTNLDKSPAVESLVRYAYEYGKLVCAICAAPIVLARLGILDGCNAVCYPGFEKYLKNAKISEDYVCRDGKVITAKGMGVAIDFALEIAKYFIGEAATAELRETLMCNE